LDVFAEKNNVDIKIQVLNNFEERAQMLSVYPQYTTLVESVVEKYVNNLAGHFGAQFVSEELREKTRVKQHLSAKEQQQYQENLEMLKAFAEQHNGDADSVIAKNMGKSPEIPDINSLWKEEPLTPEDKELYAKCLSGETLPEQPREIDLQALMAEAHEAEKTKSTHTSEAKRVVEEPKTVEPNPVLPFAEQSPPPSAEHARPVEEKQHAQTSPADTTRIVHSWPTANPTVVATVIRLWAQNFTAPGIGMQWAPTATGATVSFDTVDTDRELALHVSASSDPDGCVRVTSTLMVNAPNGETQVADLREEGDLVARVVSHLESKLAVALTEVIVTGPDIPVIDAVPTKSKGVAINIPVDSRADVEEAFASVKEANTFLKWSDPDGKRPESTTSKTPAEEKGWKEKVETPRRRDPAVMEKAAQLGVRLEKFENRGLEDAAMKELKALLSNSRTEGFVQVIKSYGPNTTTEEPPEPPSAYAVAAGVDERSTPAQTASRRAQSKGEEKVEAEEGSLEALFKAGERMSSLSLADILNRPTLGETPDQLRGPTPTVPMSLPGSLISTGEGLDIFQSPAELHETLTGTPAPYKTPLHPTSVAGQQELAANFDPNRPPDVANYERDNLRMSNLIQTLNQTQPEMHDLVIDSYRDLLLSENIMFLLRRAQVTVESMEERQFFKKITDKTVSLVTELSILVKTESARHLATIQDVCHIISEYQDDEEQYLDRMDAMKPYFDQDFLTYLTHAIGEEMNHMRQGGVDPTLAPSTWLRVLTIMRQGVEAEFETRYGHLIESLLMVARWDKPEHDEIRSRIFKRFVEITPAMELPHLKQLAVNMVDHVMARHAVETGQAPSHPLFAAAQTEHPMDPKELRVLVNQMRNMRKDIDAHLTDAYLSEKLTEWQEEARAEGTTIYLRHRNPVRQDAIDTANALYQREMKQMGLKGEIKAPKLLSDGRGEEE